MEPSELTNPADALYLCFQRQIAEFQILEHPLPKRILAEPGVVVATRWPRHDLFGVPAPAERLGVEELESGQLVGDHLPGRVVWKYPQWLWLAV